MKLPQAQTESLITRWVDGELIIVDEATHAAHCLSDPAARVFMQCTGKHTPEQIAAAEQMSLEQVTDVLERLADAGLLLSAPSKLDLTRRAFTGRTLRATALAAAGAPIITSLLLPAAAHASPLACSQVACKQASLTHTTRTAASSAAKTAADYSCAHYNSYACGATATCVGAYTLTSSKLATTSSPRSSFTVSYAGHCSSQA